MVTREITKEEFRIEGMTCESCLRTITQAIDTMPVENSKVMLGRAEVTYDTTKINRKQIELAIRDAGYKVIQ
jgi:copper chaperone CopZ